MSVEYGFNRAVFSEELQTPETRGIVDYVQGRLTLTANPSVEVITRGPADEGLSPVFDIAARAAWRMTNRVSVAGDHFSADSTRHLGPESSAHHLIFAGAEWAASSRWEVAFGAGHCLTQREPWLVRSILAYRFG